MKKRKHFISTIAFLVIVLFLLGLAGCANTNKDKKITEIKDPQKVQEVATEEMSYGGLPVLMYHHIAENPDKSNDAIVSPEQFRKDLEALKKLKYKTMFFKEVVNLIENNQPIPQNAILITFDDGYKSNYTYAYPILKELNMKATISVVGWSVGRTKNKDNVSDIFPHFTWEQAKEMYDSGVIDIQCHSFDLHTIEGVKIKENEDDKTYEKRFTDDTVKMKKLIEEKVGNEVIVFAYPSGFYNDISEKELKKLGFKVSLTVEKGINEIPTKISDLYLMKRINMTSFLKSEDRIALVIKMQKDKDEAIAVSNP